jgi:adenylate cyclase
MCFFDIVDYTRQSRTLRDNELVAWLEEFETTVLEAVVESGGRIIKNIGDELMIACDTPESAAAIALALTARAEDPEDDFPSVRVGVAHGEVVIRLGDVFGPIVNIASRLTSVARPNTVLIDLGMYEALTGRSGADDDTDDATDDTAPFRLRRVSRLRVKGYSRLKVWRLLPARISD